VCASVLPHADGIEHGINASACDGTGAIGEVRAELPRVLADDLLRIGDPAVDVADLVVRLQKRNTVALLSIEPLGSRIVGKKVSIIFGSFPHRKNPKLVQYFAPLRYCSGVLPSVLHASL
jgi:hypothetical protein